MFREMSWIVLGVLVGTAFCFAVVPSPVEFSIEIPASVASFVVVAMLLCSQRQPSLTPAH